MPDAPSLGLWERGLAFSGCPTASSHPSLLCRPFLQPFPVALLSRSRSAPPGRLSSSCPAGATPLHSPPWASLGAAGGPLHLRCLLSFSLLSGALWTDPRTPPGLFLAPLSLRAVPLSFSFSFPWVPRSSELTWLPEKGQRSVELLFPELEGAPSRVRAQTVSGGTGSSLPAAVTWLSVCVYTSVMAQFGMGGLSGRGLVTPWMSCFQSKEGPPAQGVLGEGGEESSLC